MIKASDNQHDFWHVTYTIFFCRIHIICLKKIDSLWQLRTSPRRTSCAVLSAVQCRCALDVNSCIFQYLHGFCSLVWNIIQIHPTSLINFVSAIRLLFVDMILSSRHSVSFAYIANALHINYEIWILAPFQTVWYQKKVETYIFFKMTQSTKHVPWGILFFRYLFPHNWSQQTRLKV